MDKKKYYCSKHGGDGVAECKECQKKLKMLVKDNDGYLTGDFK